MNSIVKHTLLVLFCTAAGWGLPLPLYGQDEGDAPEVQESDAETPEDVYPERYVYRQKGLLAFSDGIYETAARFFKRYRDATEGREPDFTDATILLIRTYLRHNDPENARRALEYHALRSPGVKSDDYAENLAYWQIALLFTEEKFAAAIAAANALIKTAEAPELKAKSLYLMGNSHIELRNWNQAVDPFTRLLANYPQAKLAQEARFRLAYTYLLIDQPDQAADILEDIRERIEDEETRPATRIEIYRALLQLHRGELDQTLEAYRRLKPAASLKSSREWWLLLSRLIAATKSRNDYQLAAELAAEAEKAAASRDQKIQARLQRAQALIQAEQPEPAIEVLKTFKEDYPDAPEAADAEFKLATLLYEQENFAEAALHFENLAANEKAPVNRRFEALLNRGRALMKIANHGDAVTAFAAAHRLGQTAQQKAEALFLAGEASDRQANHGDAAMYFQDVADNYPGTELAEPARFRQAQARASAGLFSDAARVFSSFLEEYPESEKRQAAYIERGIALKQAGNYQQAIDVFDTFVTQFPADEKIPRALMEGFAAAKAEGAVKKALAFLDQVITEHSEADLYMHALYQKIHYQYLQGHTEKAVADSTKFLDKFERVPLSADVLLWTGDHLANEENYADAEAYYLKAVSSHPETIQAQIALFEAARCAYKRNNPNRAAAFLEQLHKDYEATEAPNLHARSLMLQGDILTEEGNFEEALELFKSAAATADDETMQLASRGRVGDMLYAMALNGEESSPDQEMLEQALEKYTEIATSEKASKSLQEKARYRRGKCYEKMGADEKAIDTYLDLFYQYEITLQKEEVTDWYYFRRSGYDAARLLILQDTPRGQDNLKNAARIYERLARAGIPTSEEAREKARELRQKLDE